MEKNAAAGGTPSSVPISTLPPVSPILSSPKLVPPSPLNEKLQSTRLDNINPNIWAWPENVDGNGGSNSIVADQFDSRKLSLMQRQEEWDEKNVGSGGMLLLNCFRFSVLTSNLN